CAISVPRCCCAASSPDTTSRVRAKSRARRRRTMAQDSRRRRRQFDAERRRTSAVERPRYPPPRAIRRGGSAMQIRQFRVVLRAKNFDRTCNFYGEVLALPRLQSWDDEDGRGALFQAVAGAGEVIGRPRDSHGWDEDFDYSGPQHKLVLSWLVPSAERAYEELLF